MNTTDWTRRHVLIGSAGWAAARALHAADAPTRKAVIIGHTGAGDYGHGIERIFKGLPDVSVVAIADPNETGRAKAKAACGAAKDYADYREMLDKEKPDLVAIGPRWATEHHAMAMAALEAGAHLYLEKPFTVTLHEADDILRLAKEKQRRIAVAHVARMAPTVLRLEKALRERLIGEVLEIHTVGKMGSRAGGQDMMVLGLHVFDLHGSSLARCSGVRRGCGIRANYRPSPMRRNHRRTRSGRWSATTSSRTSRWTQG